MSAITSVNIQLEKSFSKCKQTAAKVCKQTAAKVCKQTADKVCKQTADNCKQKAGKIV
jgi:hypothetical protein